MAATNKKIDAIRRLILGPLYMDCLENPLGVKRDVLQERFEELKREGCVGGDCGFDELVKVCQLKSHYPTCLSDDRKCIEDMGERSTGDKKFYYQKYKRAKEIEDEADESSSDEEDEIECPSCLMNEDGNGIRLVETVTNPETEQGQLSCGHLVHKSCLIRTAVNKGRDRAECPLCNTVFELNEVPVPVRDRDTRERDNMRRAVLNGTQMSRSFADIADVYGYTPEELLEIIDMTVEEASAYYSIPLDQILVPVNRRLDFGSEGDSDNESGDDNDAIENIIEHIQNEDIQIAIQMTEGKIEEEGYNAWVTHDIIREILNGILNLDRRRDLNDLLALFLLTYHDNIIHYQNDMDEFIANSIVRMFRSSITKRGIAKLILLHIIKTDSIGMYYILLHILKGYDSIATTTENEVITFIFEAYNGFTERNEEVAEINNETDGNTVLKGFLNDVFEEDEFRRWRNMTDVSDLIRGWLRQYFPDEVEFESDYEEDEE
jgi:hypothetical protein